MFLRQNLRPTIRPTIRPNLRWPQNPNIRLAPNIRLGPEVRLFATYSAIYPNFWLILTIFWCFETKIYHFGDLFLTNIRLIWPNVRYLPNLRLLTEGPAPAKCSVIWPAGGPAPAGGQNSTFVLTLLHKHGGQFSSDEKVSVLWLRESGAYEWMIYAQHIASYLRAWAKIGIPLSRAMHKRASLPACPDLRRIKVEGRVKSSGEGLKQKI